MSARGPYLRPEPRPLPDLDAAPRYADLVWGVVFVALGALLLVATPATGPTVFVLAGWLGLGAGAGFVARWYLISGTRSTYRKENP